MKVFFISATAFVIYLMRVKKPYCTTYDIMGDNFPHIKVLLPTALVFSIIINSGWDIWEFAWSYSLWLESVAFIP